LYPQAGAAAFAGRAPAPPWGWEAAEDEEAVEGEAAGELAVWCSAQRAKRAEAAVA
jgi:hypothetical protein